MAKICVEVGNLSAPQLLNLLGLQDKNCQLLSSCLQVDVSFSHSCFNVSSDDQKKVDNSKKVIEVLLDMVLRNQLIKESDIVYACRCVEKDTLVQTMNFHDKIIGKTLSGKQNAPKTKGQYLFVEALEKSTMTFVIGPAGTGKTYLAVIYAVKLLKKGDIKKIVLTRPAVEAGESLGFLPGDLKEKVDPYLTPLYDALYEMLGTEQTNKYIEKGIIEIAPLAYMRGRTLDDAMVILDEAQNTTPMQMKMFLTRLGNQSKMVITGDVTQIDLHKGQTSGLIHVCDILKEIEEIQFIYLTSDDVVRHPLVQKIIDCYDRHS